MPLITYGIDLAQLPDDDSATDWPWATPHTLTSVTEHEGEDDRYAVSERERFVPQRLGPLTTQLCDLRWDDDSDREKFRAFTRLASALYHHEFHEREQAMLDAWENVGRDPQAADHITAELTGLLEGANYTAVTMDELDEAMERESLIPLRLEVDLDDYDEVLIYRRGSRQEVVDVARWKGLRSEEKTITTDDRVVVHTRVKPRWWFEDREIEPDDRNLVPGHISLKQFQNVPRADIEMLLPSTQVRFRLIDSLMVGVPAVISGIVVLATKLLPTLGLIILVLGAWLGFRDEEPVLDQTALVVLFGGAITLAGFLFRQWSKLKNRRVRYLKTLSENLYFRTLGDGPGVLHTLLAAAEEQEIVEVLLAYRFLLANPGGITEHDLDQHIERWLNETFHHDVDFEVDDAVAKLRRLEVIDGVSTLTPRPLDTTLVELDRRWDELFIFHAPTSVPTVAASQRSGRLPPDSPVRTTRLIRLRRVVDRFRGRVGERTVVTENDADTESTSTD